MKTYEMTVSLNLWTIGKAVFNTYADNLLKRIDELKVGLQLQCYDVIAITEVYPKTGKPDAIQLSVLHEDGYNM